MIEYKKEALYLVDGDTYLHLQEQEGKGFAYETFNKADGSRQDTGLISMTDMLENPNRNPTACARVMAIEEIGLKGEVVSEVALRTLDQLKDAKRAYRRAHRDDPHDHSIRFITPNYDELFRIPNGGRVQVDYPDRSFSARCEYIDDYHTRIGGEVYHICQFAEMLERGGGKASPEPELVADRAAWQIGHKRYLEVQSTEDGWDYTVLDKNFAELDGGQIDLSSLTIQQCRDMILEDMGLQNQNLFLEDYDMVEERAADVAEEHLNSVLEQLKEKRAVTGAKTDDPSKSAALTPGKRRTEECL